VHHEVVVRAAEFESHWRRLTWHRDAPLSEPADVAVNQLAVAASDHVKVVLSGEGADEVFGGYPKHRFATVTGLPLPAPLRWGFDRLERTVPPSMGRARMGLRALSAASPAERMEAWFAPFTRTERTRLLGSAAPEWSGVQPAEGVTSLRTMLEADCGAWLSDNLLERGDRMSMAASIELRPPFLDHRVIELGLSLPDRMKVRRGTGKWVLRELARSRLPSVIIDRPKVGFRVPLDRWFRDGMRSFAWDTLTAAGSFSSQVFDAAEVVRLLERHDRSRADESIRIWTLLGLEIWHQCTVASRRQAAAVGS
jgi:asparagine synthase (glutamine-hydrolysing)